MRLSSTPVSFSFSFITPFFSQIFPHETSRHQSNYDNNSFHFLVSSPVLQTTNLSWQGRKGPRMMNK